MIDSYRTVEAPADARIARLRSRFVCQLLPVSELEHIPTHLDRIRREMHDASHHCHAYRILDGDAHSAGYDDDGEPHGSAGEPILRQIEAADLTNILAVVTRYFGGAKLGIGGLIRAYGDAVRAALERASVVRRELRTSLQLLVPQQAGGSVMGLVHRYGGVIKDTQYADRARIIASLAPSRVDPFIGALRELTGDRAQWKALS